MNGAARTRRVLALQAVVEQQSPPDRERLEVRLHRAANACGCSTGSVALLVTVVVAVGWWLLALDAQLALWPEAAVAALGVVGAALLGKLAGLAAAYVWIWWVGRRLRRA